MEENRSYDAREDSMASVDSIVDHNLLTAFAVFDIKQPSQPAKDAFSWTEVLTAFQHDSGVRRKQIEVASMQAEIE